MVSNEFISGSINGISQAIIGHPLDTIKVLQQNNLSLKHLKLIDLTRGIQYPLYYKLITNSMCFDLNKNINIENNFIRNSIVGLYMSPFTHIIDLFKIYRQNGKSLRQLSYNDFTNYRGFLCTISRDMISYSLYIPIYIVMKDNGYNTPISGAIAGLTNWTASYPIDVIRTRQISNYNNTLYDSIKMGSIWRGYPACALRSILATSIGFTMYEEAFKLIK